MNVKFKVDGFDQLDRMLRQLPLRVGRSMLRAGAIKAAEPIRQTMSQLAPHRPGAPDLRSNIGISEIKTKGGALEAAVAIGPTREFFYGYYQEFGTSRHGAQPFARPAFDTKTMQSIQILKAELWRALVGRGLSTRAGSSGGGLL